MNRPLSTVSKVNAGMAASFLRSLSEVASLGRNKQARKATARSSPNRIQTVRFSFAIHGILLSKPDIEWVKGAVHQIAGHDQQQYKQCKGFQCVEDLTGGGVLGEADKPIPEEGVAPKTARISTRAKLRRQ